MTLHSLMSSCLEGLEVSCTVCVQVRVQRVPDQVQSALEAERALMLQRAGERHLASGGVHRSSSRCIFTAIGTHAMTQFEEN